MPRREVEFIAGEFYHLFNRGVDRIPIFYDHENYLYFTRLLLTKAQKHEVAIVAYCLMPNHFHLLARPALDHRLGLFVRGVCGSYAQALNTQRGRSGALFQGRFRAVRVDRDEYLAHLARYIHWNPVEAGLVTRPGEWPHSDYARARHDGTLIGGIFPDKVAYQRFVEEPQAFELPGSLKLPGS